MQPLEPDGRISLLHADAAATGLAACSVDVVQLSLVMHELPPAAAGDIFAEAHRILRPGGIFITREHDLIPMLDCAHMVFNAVLNVSAQDESTERRGFRPLAHWRAIVQACGFRDTMVYGRPNQGRHDVALPRSTAAPPTK